MIDHLATLLGWIAYLSGLGYTAPRFAAEEAARRGRTTVHHDDTVWGITRGIFWPFAWFGLYTKHAGDKHLKKMPEVRKALLMKTDEEQHRLDDDLDEMLRAHARSLENKNDGETI